SVLDSIVSPCLKYDILTVDLFRQSAHQESILLAHEAWQHQYLNAVSSLRKRFSQYLYGDLPGQYVEVFRLFVYLFSFSLLFMFIVKLYLLPKKVNFSSSEKSSYNSIS